MVAAKQALWPIEPVSFPLELPVNAFLHSVRAVDFHIHAAFEVLIVLEGAILLYTEAGARRLVVGDMAIVHGWQAHAT